MTFGERWDLAEDSELTIIGRFVLISSIIFFIFRVGIWFVSIAKPIGDSTGEIILLVVLLFMGGLCVLALGFLIIFLFGLAIFWILGDDIYFDWDDIIEIIMTVYKLVFGDYKGKFDFIRKYFYEKT